MNKYHLLTLILFVIIFSGCQKAEEKKAVDANEVIVEAPEVVSVDPNYAANNNLPVVSGTATKTLIVKIYSDAACAASVLASGVADNSGNFSITVPVADDSTTTMYAKAFNGPYTSPCSTSFVTYVEDSAPPAMPTMTSVVPVGPANQNNITVKGTAAALSIVKIFTNNTCTGTPVATVTANGSGNFSQSLTVSDNTTTKFYGATYKSNGNHSACSSTSVTYIEDSTPPAPPVITSSAPVSPSNTSITPAIQGTSEKSATIKLYTNNTCTSSVVGTGTSNGSGNFSINVTVNPNTTTYFYATATDVAGNISSCSLAAFSYVHDDTPPLKPILSTILPASPSDVRNPLVSGTAELNTTLKIYNDNACSGAILKTITVDASGNFSTNILVGDNQSLTLYATATDAASNTSPCSTAPLNYQHYTIPQGVLFIQGTTTMAPSTNTNFNQATAYPIKFTTRNEYHSDYYSHSVTMNSHQITAKVSGDYFLSLVIPLSGSVADGSVRAEVRVNGTVVPQGITESGHISNAGAHTESSLHLATLLPNLNANDVIDVTVQGVGTAGTITGVATLTMEYIQGTRNIFYATATQSINSTNLNQSTSYALEWTDLIKKSSFVHSNLTNQDQISLNSSGNYLVYFNLPVESSDPEVHVVAQVKLDGVPLSYGNISQGFIKGAGNTKSSLHWAALLPNVVAGSVLTIDVGLEAASGTVTTTTGNVASLFIEKLSSPVGLFMSRTTTGTSNTNWNAGTQNAKWNLDDMIDSGFYTHSISSNADRVTLNQAGDYFVILNMPTTSSVANTNWRSRLYVNGVYITGADSKTTYISNLSGHNESSNSMVFLLRKRNASDIVTVQATREAATGTVTSHGDSSLILLYKPNSTSP